MHDVAVLVEDDQHGEAEAAGVAQSFHGLFVLVLLGVVDVDVDEVLLNQIGNLLIVGDEIGEAQAPGAPVATHLADDKAAALAGLVKGAVDLFHGVDVLVVELYLIAVGGDVFLGDLLFLDFFSVLFEVDGLRLSPHGEGQTHYHCCN